MLYFNGTEWSFPAVVSYLFFGLSIYWGNKHIFLVPYEVDDESTHDSYNRMQYDRILRYTPRFAADARGNVDIK